MPFVGDGASVTVYSRKEQLSKPTLARLHKFAEKADKRDVRGLKSAATSRSLDNRG